MLSKFFSYFITALVLFGALYLVLFIWWLFLPLFIVLLGIAAWRVYQARKMWNGLLKQAQKAQSNRKHFSKVSDDNVIDVDYEEIKQ